MNAQRYVSLARSLSMKRLGQTPGGGGGPGGSWPLFPTRTTIERWALTVGTSVVAMNVSWKAPTCEADGVHLSVALAGFPSEMRSTAPAGRFPEARIRTMTAGAPGALAANGTDSCVFAATPMTAPSGGVCASHVTIASRAAGVAADGASIAKPIAAIATKGSRRSAFSQEVMI